MSTNIPNVRSPRYLDDNECCAAANLGGKLETGVVSCVEAHYEGWLRLAVSCLLKWFPTTRPSIVKCKIIMLVKLKYKNPHQALLRFSYISFYGLVMNEFDEAVEITMVVSQVSKHIHPKFNGNLRLHHLQGLLRSVPGIQNILLVVGII